MQAFQPTAHAKSHCFGGYHVNPTGKGGLYPGRILGFYIYPENPQVFGALDCSPLRTLADPGAATGSPCLWFPRAPTPPPWRPQWPTPAEQPAPAQQWGPWMRHSARAKRGISPDAARSFHVSCVAQSLKFTCTLALQLFFSDQSGSVAISQTLHVGNSYSHLPSKWGQMYLHGVCGIRRSSKQMAGTFSATFHQVLPRGTQETKAPPAQQRKIPFCHDPKASLR